MYWGFFFRLLMGAVAAPFVYSLALAAVGGLSILFGMARPAPPRSVTFLVAAIALLIQAYVWGLWAAYCAALVGAHIASPAVIHRWIYYVTAFYFAIGPLQWLTAKEAQSITSDTERQSMRRGSALWQTAIIAAFVGFSFAPSISTLPYGWALRATVPVLIGREDEVQGEPFEVHCPEPVGTFTLGRKSHPTDAQVSQLCSCVYQSLGEWERAAIEKFARGEGSQVSALDKAALPARFGAAVEKCGGMNL